MIFDDLPFEVVAVPSPYTISRLAEFPSPAVITFYYDLGNDDAAKAACARFADKRAWLLSAFNKLIALPGYTMTANTPADDALKRAQLICANTARGQSGNTDFYSMLIAMGVKRERRGKAETEFFSPAERNQSDNLTGKAGEVLDILNAAGYKEARTFGQTMTSDPAIQQKFGGIL